MRGQAQGFCFRFCGIFLKNMGIILYCNFSRWHDTTLTFSRVWLLLPFKMCLLHHMNILSQKILHDMNEYSLPKNIVTCNLTPEQRVLSHGCLQVGRRFHLQVSGNCNVGKRWVVVLVLINNWWTLWSWRVISIGGRNPRLGFATHCSVSDDCSFFTSATFPMIGQSKASTPTLLGY